MYVQLSAHSQIPTLLGDRTNQWKREHTYISPSGFSLANLKARSTDTGSDEKKTHSATPPGLGLCAFRHGPLTGPLMVSRIQWKPFWLTTQLYPPNDWLGWPTKWCELWRIRAGPVHFFFRPAVSSESIFVEKMGREIDWEWSRQERAFDAFCLYIIVHEFCAVCALCT